MILITHKDVLEEQARTTLGLTFYILFLKHIAVSGIKTKIKFGFGIVLEINSEKEIS